jgi:hypothetical protein
MDALHTTYVATFFDGNSRRVADPVTIKSGDRGGSVVIPLVGVRDALRNGYLRVDVRVERAGNKRRPAEFHLRMRDETPMLVGVVH